MPTETDSYNFLETPGLLPRGSVTQAVTDQLRRAIVTLELKPGEVLDKNAICARLGVSRFPVSEALQRLQAEGLVDILPQRGSVVSHVRIGDVEEYMLIRKALECEAVRVLIGNHTAAMVIDLRENMAAQRLAAERDDREGFHQLDLGFHELLFAPMRFSKINTTIDSARANLDRARRLIISPRRLTFSINEHQAVLNAIVANDAPAAMAAMRAHIDSVMAELFDFVRDRPELFADPGEPARIAAPRNFPFG